jgi:hypothetical protein
MVAAVSIWGTTIPGLGCTKTAAASYGASPSEWCYEVSITITNTGTTTLTNYAARFPVNAASLIGSGQMDSRVWSAYPYIGSFSNESDLLAQDTSSSTAGWWTQIASLAPGNTQITTLLFGLAEVVADRGVLFTGNDVVSVPHVAAFNITDNLDLTVEVEMLGVSGAAVAQTSTLAAHLTGNQGYGLYLRVVGGNLTIRGQIDNQTCDVTWNAAWTDTNRNVQMTFANPTLRILVDGVVQNTCATGLPSITATSTALTWGNSMQSGIIRDVRLAGASLVGHWGMDPSTLAETSSSNPYTGTVADESGAGNTGTYTFNRSQAMLTVTVGAVTLVSAAPLPALPTPLPSLLGTDLFGVGLGVSPTPATGLFRSVLGQPLASFTGPNQLLWGLIALGFGLALMLPVQMRFRYMPFSLFVMGVPYVVIALMHYLSFWYVFFWALLVGLGWLAQRYGEQNA